MNNDQIEEKLIELDESMREIEGLADLYENLVGESAKDRRDLDIRQEEARFARDRLLRLSLHIKNLLDVIESEES